MTFLPGYIDRIDKISMMCGLKCEHLFWIKELFQSQINVPLNIKPLNQTT